MAALYRQAPLNAIWEGSGNVIALDVLRAVAREPESLAALFAELDAGADAARGSHWMPHSGYLAVVEELRAELVDVAGTGAEKGGEELECAGRSLVDRLALCFSASCLLRFGNVDVARTFLATRFLPADSARTSLHSAGAVVGAVLGQGDIEHVVERLFVM